MRGAGFTPTRGGGKHLGDPRKRGVSRQPRGEGGVKTREKVFYRGILWGRTWSGGSAGTSGRFGSGGETMYLGGLCKGRVCVETGTVSVGNNDHTDEVWWGLGEVKRGFVRLRQERCVGRKCWAGQSLKERSRRVAGGEPGQGGL